MGTALVKMFPDILSAETVSCLGALESLVALTGEAVSACIPSASADPQVARPNAVEAATTATRQTARTSLFFSGGVSKSRFNGVGIEDPEGVSGRERGPCSQRERQPQEGLRIFISS